MKQSRRTITLLMLLCLLLSTCSFSSFAVSVFPFTVTAEGAKTTVDRANNTLKITYPENTSTAVLKITQQFGKRARIYAAPCKQQPVSLNDSQKVSVNLTQKYTYLYVTINDTQQYTLQLISPRTPTDYKDEIDISVWSLPYLNYCNEEGMGIILGDQFGNATPRAFMTRNEIATVSARFLGLDCAKFSTDSVKFEDTPIQWARPAAYALATLGIISGHKENGKYYFRGDKHVSRQEVAVIMVNLLLLKTGNQSSATSLYQKNKSTYEKKLSSFADQKTIASWARPYMALAVNYFKFYNGSARGNKLYLNPSHRITREEMMAMIARRMDFDIDKILYGQITKAWKLIQKIDTVPQVFRTRLKDAYRTAVKAYEGQDEGKKNNAYSKLYVLNDLITAPPLIYLSPSRQMHNPYTGVDTNEGAQMQAIASRLTPMLKEMGFQVYTANTNTQLVDRAFEAKRLEADIYVAIHSNACGTQNNGYWQGSIVYHSNNPGSEQLAKMTSSYISALTPTKDNGIKNNSYAAGPYTEILFPKMANVLIEVEYHDYSRYANWIYSHKSLLARAIADGILDYYLRY